MGRMSNYVVYNEDWDRSEPYVERTTDPSYTWTTTSRIAKQEWLRLHRLHESHALRSYDQLPQYVKQKWESDSEG